MAEITATERTRQQGARLKALRKRLGLSKGVLIDALSFGSTQTYDLYERGVSVIRLDRVTEWASAFGMSEFEFIEAVLQPSRERPQRATVSVPWSMADYLRGHIPEADIPGFVAEWADVPPADQKAAADEIIASYHRVVAEATLKPRRNRPA